MNRVLTAVTAVAAAGGAYAAWLIYTRYADVVDAPTAGGKRPRTRPETAPGAKGVVHGKDYYRQLTVQAAERHGVPPNLFLRLIQRESNFRPYVVGVTGDLGIAQLNPRFHPRSVAMDPPRALDYAADYLRQQFNRFGSWREAVAAYNWGPTNLAKYGMRKIPASTMAFVNYITGS